MIKENIVSVSGLTKKYKNTVAVDNINLEIKTGSILGFIGRNGAGKTTFLKLLSGLINPTEGNINIDSTIRTGILIEDAGLFKNMTAYDNLKSCYLCLGYKYTKEMINHLIELVGLKGAKKKKVKEYSLGMRQRLGIALSLVGNPNLILLDEPINGLDPIGIRDVRELILKLNKEGKTFVISSHILTELAKVATDFCIVDNGKVIANKTKEEFLDESKDVSLDDYYFNLIGGPSHE